MLFVHHGPKDCLDSVIQDQSSSSAQGVTGHFPNHSLSCADSSPTNASWHSRFVVSRGIDQPGKRAFKVCRAVKMAAPSQVLLRIGGSAGAPGTRTCVWPQHAVSENSAAEVPRRAKTTVRFSPRAAME